MGSVSSIYVPRSIRQNLGTKKPGRAHGTCRACIEMARVYDEGPDPSVRFCTIWYLEASSSLYC